MATSHTHEFEAGFRIAVASMSWATSRRILLAVISLATNVAKASNCAVGVPSSNANSIMSSGVMDANGVVELRRITSSPRGFR